MGLHPVNTMKKHTIVNTSVSAAIAYTTFKYVSGNIYGQFRYSAWNLDHS